MKSGQKESWSGLVRRHRNVYRFGGQWARTLLASAPWINALILVCLLLFVHGRLVIAPGMMFDLPRAPLREGGRDGLTALMISVSRDMPGGDETLVFLDDDRFNLGDDSQVVLLAERIKGRISQSAARELLLMADKRVPHGDVVLFVNVAREAGAQRVNVSEKPN
ncbi:MAG: hypothetical protein PHU80_00675 [Kiritimatiellae bacterium]|nr:hypothetical protein [Kiritimatiellia bacterium]